jgi:hypothetical protein
MATGLFSTIEERATMSASNNVFDRAVALSLDFHRLGTSKKVNSGAVRVGNEIESETDKDYIRVQKDILKSEQLEAIKKHDGVTARMIRDRSIPSLFKSGLYLVGLPNVAEVDALLENRIEARNGLVALFLSRYQEQASRAKSALGPLYDPRDYPSVEIVKSRFSVEYSFIEFAAPGRLASVNPELLRREQEKMRATVQNAVDEGLKLLRLQMSDLVDHMIERLSPGADGKKKVFRDTLTENIDEFLRLFNGNNLAADAELQAFVDKARDLMKGIDSEVLRKQDTVRDKVLSGFQDIKAGVDQLLIDAPARVFRSDPWGDL